MYSMSVLNLAKFKEVAISIRSGFGGPLEGGPALLTSPAGQTTVDGDDFPSNSRDVQDVANELRSYIQEHDLSDSVYVRVEERGLVISLSTDDLLFPIGSAEMRPESAQILDKIAGLIDSVANQVLVEGHTCNLPIHTLQFPSNWELSSARASRVIRYLIENHHIAPERLAAAGYADTKPVAPNDTEANRRRNRHVNIVIIT